MLLRTEPISFWYDLVQPSTSLPTFPLALTTHHHSHDSRWIGGNRGVWGGEVLLLLIDLHQSGWTIRLKHEATIFVCRKALQWGPFGGKYHQHFPDWMVPCIYLGFQLNPLFAGSHPLCCSYRSIFYPDDPYDGKWPCSTPGMISISSLRLSTVQTVISWLSIPPSLSPTFPFVAWAHGLPRPYHRLWLSYWWFCYTSFFYPCSLLPFFWNVLWFASGLWGCHYPFILPLIGFNYEYFQHFQFLLFILHHLIALSYLLPSEVSPTILRFGHQLLDCRLLGCWGCWGCWDCWRCCNCRNKGAWGAVVISKLLFDMKLHQFLVDFS